jgi:DNA-binding HxlR family transcriptional regulator
MTKTYGQQCPIAMVLDVIGDRWSLLIVRELMLGPMRFTDIAAGLPGVGTRQLTERLRWFSDEGVIESVRLSTPGDAPGYASCKKRGLCPSGGARRMAQTTAHLVDQVAPHVPVRQWVLALPIPLGLLLAAQPKLVTPVLQVVHRAITRHLLGQAGAKADEAESGAVTLIQRFGSAASWSIHLHCLVLDGVYRRNADGAPVFVEVQAPTGEALQAVLRRIITRMMKLFTRKGVLVEEEGHTYMAEGDADSDEARVLRPLQAAACTYRIAFGPRAGQKVMTVQGTMPRDTSRRRFAPTSTASACTPPCAAAPTTARGWSSCAATSRGLPWPTSACKPTRPGKWCSSSRPPGATAPRTS